MTAPTYDTTILDALNALVRIATAAVPSTVQVIYGEPLNTEDDFVAIGYGGGEGHPAVTFQLDVADEALGRAAEVYDVEGLISSWRGEKDFSLVDVEAFSLLKMLRAAVAADRKLGGVVALARFTSGSLVHEIEGDGSVASIPFTISVQAWSR